MALCANLVAAMSWQAQGRALAAFSSRTASQRERTFPCSCSLDYLHTYKEVIYLVIYLIYSKIYIYIYIFNLLNLYFKDGL